MWLVMVWGALILNYCQKRERVSCETVTVAPKISRTALQNQLFYWSSLIEKYSSFSLRISFNNYKNCFLALLINNNIKDLQKTKNPANSCTYVTCVAAADSFFWTFIHDLKSVQALHGFFFTSPVFPCSLPGRSSGDLPATANGNPSKPVGSEACDPLGAVGAAMFAITQ